MDKHPKLATNIPATNPRGIVVKSEYSTGNNNGIEVITKAIFGDFFNNVKKEISTKGAKAKRLLIKGRHLLAGKPNLYKGTATKASIIELYACP